MPRQARPAPDVIALTRLASQRLAGEGFRNPSDVVRWLGAVQAQDYAGAKWALALRGRGFTDAALDRAFNEGRFLRTHVMRPTWHFVAPEDLRWLLALTAPRVHAANAYVYRTVELDGAVFSRARKVIAAALRGGRALTRVEIGARLDKRGIPVSGLRLACIVMHAELEGLVCSGPLRGKQHTYMLLDERVPPVEPLTRDEALETLSRRFFTSHGPATARDLAWWSGLTMADARRSIALAGPALQPIVIEGSTLWTSADRDVSPAPRSATSVLHLLPNFDEHVVAYRDREHTFHPDLRSAQRRGDQPLAVHFITRDGLVIGGWRRRLEKARVVASIQPLAALSERDRRALVKAADAYARFLERPVTIEEHPPSSPGVARGSARRARSA
jgi:hypothetical protein